jgi:hypothetical protein
MRAGDRHGATAAMEFHLGRLLREVDRAEIWDPAYFIEDAAPSRASQDEKDIPDAD